MRKDVAMSRKKQRKQQRRLEQRAEMAAAMSKDIRNDQFPGDLLWSDGSRLGDTEWKEAAANGQ
jgi:predicted ribosome quality control (RQC) complex YloA/Tae2 family protein